MAATSPTTTTRTTTRTMGLSFDENESVSNCSEKTCSTTTSTMASPESAFSLMVEGDYTYAPTSSAMAKSAMAILETRIGERLASSSSSGELRLLSMKESFDRSILTQFYEELMIPNFPLEEERDDLEDWLLYLDPTFSKEEEEDSDNDGPQDGTSMDVLILTIDNGTTTTILGGIAFEYYPQAQVGLLSYMVVSTEFRRLGILGTLHPVFCHALQGLHELTTQAHTPIAAILAETNTATAGDVPTQVARKRHEILFKLGYRLLQFPYVQPPLATDGESFDDIMLLLYVGNNSSNSSQSTSTSSMDTTILYKYVLDFYYSVFGTNQEPLFQDHWYFQLVTWYQQQCPSTHIQTQLPWEDVTPTFLAQMKQQQQQQQEEGK
ncbi:expressed unknown protein [Seminavis robusta]|uniref:Uncharacterized protein n=1 Tax=Seminavis robusta TaxID=568900 RepID=A0A9N8EGM0_9STRA|nr:expressed unknown protein [Seminavis robusta]|eukprot:Sro1133_g244820.1 n/a (380) ;mRNA; r:18406-19545